MLGIVITTYNRIEKLQHLLDNLRQYTDEPNKLIIVDDGSKDGTADWCRNNGYLVISGENRGLVWNLNRGLAYLLHYTNCDPIMTLEDDTLPFEHGWESEWLEAVRIWGHCLWTCYQDEHTTGEGTANNPWRCKGYGTQVTITRRDVLNCVGYMDTRFSGFAAAHHDWSYRMGRHLVNTWGQPINYPPCINKGIGADFTETHTNKSEWEKSLVLRDLLRTDSIYRPAVFNSIDGEKLAGELLNAVRADQLSKSIKPYHITLSNMQ